MKTLAFCPSLSLRTFGGLVEKISSNTGLIARFRSHNFLRVLQILGVVFVFAAGVDIEFIMAQELGNAAASEPKKISFLSWLIQVSGLIGAFIFMLSVYFGAVAIRSFMQLRQSVAAPPEVVQGCEKLIESRNPRELVSLLKGDDSYFSQILLTGVMELKHGFDEAREKLERKAESLTGQMEKSISILAVLGTLGPMIGLLGTLKGMIGSFSVIAMSGVALDAAKVAEGISEALVLTFEGVALSVPAIFLYSLFRNRISTISIDTTMMADDQLRAVSRLLKGKVPLEPEVPGA
jgi:biopolymer transport protein ExbB